MANTPLTRAIVQSLLQSPFQTEDDVHSWSSVFSIDPDKPLLRTWDQWSGHNDKYFGNMAFDMISLLDVLPEPQAPAIEARPFHRGFGFSDFNTSSEEVCFEEDFFDEEYDSYDEVEEDNAMDDFLNGS
ncbi:hypothetical protein ACJ73_08696 [Blastomyces percursus]|uniref:Uncharacterized protein n=1 Tax=Blastomyces percursus TaxID=1658174 RepID=A0A1J9QRA0_9EURO|nr:hypothetical protein ACJ73_08696 [Blastomyces percursus]